MTENNTNNANNTENQEIRDNLREVGDALLSAGSALGAAVGKFVDGLPERVANASEKARETLNSATTDGEVSSVATNFANEAEKLFNSFRERDLKFSEDAKSTVMDAVADIRESFNKRLENVDTEGAEKAFTEVRDRFENLARRVQEQFAEAKETAEEAVQDAAGDVIDGEVVEDTDSTK